MHGLVIGADAGGVEFAVDASLTSGSTEHLAPGPVGAQRRHAVGDGTIEQPRELSPRGRCTLTEDRRPVGVDEDG